MRILEFGKEASLASVIEAIKSVPEKEITLRLPHDTPWLRNPVNEKILRKAVGQFEKILHFEGRIEPKVEPMKEPETPEVNEPEESKETPPIVSKDEAGFVVGGDVLAGKGGPDEPVKEKLVLPEIALSAEPSSKPNTFSKDRLANTKKVLGTLFKRRPFAIVAVVGLLLLAGVYVVFALPKADVKIVVEQRPLEREATLTASVGSEKIDVEAKKIPAQSRTSTQTGSKKAAATGSKAVGTPAKGTVTIYNRTASNKTFPAGTKISSASMQFSFDAQIMAPAGTTDPGTYVFTPGQANVSVTATSIGPEYNLNSATEFTIVGTPTADAVAKNGAAFSGGSKKDVQVVAQADLDKLLDELTKELSDKAKQAIETQGVAGEKVIDNAIKVAVTTKTYDKKVGEEAAEVTLNLEITATATTYNEEHLKDILGQTLQQASPEGYEIAEEGQSTSAELVAIEDNGDLTFVGRIRANLIPKFDKDELSRNLAGKRPDAAATYLQAIPSVVRYDISIWPNLPDFLKSFPRDAKRIKIEVSVQ